MLTLVTNLSRLARKNCAVVSVSRFCLGLWWHSVESEGTTDGAEGRGIDVIVTVQQWRVARGRFNRQMKTLMVVVPYGRS